MDEVIATNDFTNRMWLVDAHTRSLSVSTVVSKLRRQGKPV